MTAPKMTRTVSQRVSAVTGSGRGCPQRLQYSRISQLRKLHVEQRQNMETPGLTVWDVSSLVIRSVADLWRLVPNTWRPELSARCLADSKNLIYATTSESSGNLRASL